MNRMPWFFSYNSMWGTPWLGSGFVLLAVWSAIWTGLALWHAARREEKGWFIIFMFVHTAGILELIYLIFVAKAFERGRSSSRRKSR